MWRGWGVVLCPPVPGLAGGASCFPPSGVLGPRGPPGAPHLQGKPLVASTPTHPPTQSRSAGGTGLLNRPHQHKMLREGGVALQLQKASGVKIKAKPDFLKKP